MIGVMQDFDDFLRAYKTDVCAESLLNARKGLNAYQDEDVIVSVEFATAAILFAVVGAVTDDAVCVILCFVLAFICCILLILISVHIEKRRFRSEGYCEKELNEIIRSSSMGQIVSVGSQNRIAPLEMLLSEAYGIDFKDIAELNALISFCERERDDRDRLGKYAGEYSGIFGTYLLPFALSFFGIILTKLKIESMRFLQIFEIAFMVILFTVLVYFIVKIIYSIIRQHICEDRLAIEFLIYDLRHVHCFPVIHGEICPSDGNDTVSD